MELPELIGPRITNTNNRPQHIDSRQNISDKIPIKRQYFQLLEIIDCLKNDTSKTSFR